MTKIVSTNEMRTIETAANDLSISYSSMMQRAGSAVASAILTLLSSDSSLIHVCIIVGNGNNGGDGLVAAVKLQELADLEICCYLLSARDEINDLEFAAVLHAGIKVVMADNDAGYIRLHELVNQSDILVDAVLGTGTKLPIRGKALEILSTIKSILGVSRKALPETTILNRLPNSATHADKDKPVVLAVDCPSGLDCDTGEIAQCAIHADITVTFGALKWGHLRFPGASYVGELHVVDIGIDQVQDLISIPSTVATAELVHDFFPLRSNSSHKGTYGKLMVVSGSNRYIGAPKLAASAAYKIGAGLVCIATTSSICSSLAGSLVEAIWLPLESAEGAIGGNSANVLMQELEDYDALVLGPGIGLATETGRFVAQLLSPSSRKSAQGEPLSLLNKVSGRILIDADALTHLASIERWWDYVPQFTILTPHPGEMARLCASSVQEVQSNRLQMARQKAAEWNCIVVLKGPFTLIAAPDHKLTVVPIATDALAKAGTGDVLSGCIGGLLAQGVPPYEAAVAGAWVHGMAGLQSSISQSTRSVSASDIIESIGSILAKLDLVT